MNKALVLALALGGGFFGYRHFLYASPAVETYQQFCEDMLNGRYDQAERLVDETAHPQLAAYEEGMSRCRRSGQLVGASYKRISDVGAGPGTRRVELRQIVRWDPPGATSSMGAVRVFHRHRAELRETPDGWRIASFEDEVVKLLDWKGEDAEDMRGLYSPG